MEAGRELHSLEVMGINELANAFVRFESNDVANACKIFAFVTQMWLYGKLLTLFISKYSKIN